MKADPEMMERAGRAIAALRRDNTLDPCDALLFVVRPELAAKVDDRRVGVFGRDGVRDRHGTRRAA